MEVHHVDCFHKCGGLAWQSYYSILAGLFQPFHYRTDRVVEGLRGCPMKREGSHQSNGSLLAAKPKDAASGSTARRGKRKCSFASRIVFEVKCDVAVILMDPDIAGFPVVSPLTSSAQLQCVWATTETGSNSSCGSPSARRTVARTMNLDPESKLTKSNVA